MLLARIQKVNWRKLGDLVRKINEVLTDINTINILETNNIFNANITFVASNLGLRYGGN